MWKFVTRSIRESLERRTCRTNIYSQSSQDGNSNAVEQKEFFTPTFSSTSHDYFGNTKDSGAKDNEEQNNYNADFTWLEAVSWVSFDHLRMDNFKLKNYLRKEIQGFISILKLFYNKN
jgi:hypothetical protein